MSDIILVALITGGFGILTVVLNKLMKENREDHGIVADSLDRIETKLDDHIDSHDEDGNEQDQATV